VSNEAASWRIPPHELSFPSNRIDIWRVCLESSNLSESDLAGILSPDEDDRASRFHFDEDRKRFARCRVALRIILGHYLDMHPAEIRFRYEKDGKPEIANAQDSRGLRFNIANSCGLALIAVSSGRALGVDVEKVRPKLDCVEIALRVFSDREVRAFLSLPENKRQRAFFACWTRKEALLKATGKGLAYSLADFSVSVDPDGPAEVCELKENLGGAGRWFLTDLHPGEGYIGALALEGPSCSIETWCWDELY